MNTTSPSSHVVAGFTALVAVAGIAAIWAGVSLALRGPCGWMALVAAIDAALLLRLAGLAAGRYRAGVAVTTTVLSILAGIFVVGSVNIGVGFAILPHQALWLTGPQLAWTWWQLNTGAWEVLLAVLALPLAWKLAR